MAYRRRRGGYRRRFRGYGRRMRRFGGSRSGGLMFTVGGAALGYLAPRVVPMQDLAITALAVLPVKMPRSIRRVAGGYVLGAIARTFIPSGFAGLTPGQGGDYV